MAENKELKTRSFRIDEETAEKFKEIAVQIGGNQQEALAKLIEVYEFQAGKAVLTDKKAEMDKFESLLQTISHIYMSSLEETQNTKELVRTEFDSLLRSKDTIIQDLQEKIDIGDKKRQQEQEIAQIVRDENQELRTELEQLEKEHEEYRKNTEKLLQSKDSQNEALLEATKSLKERIKTLEVYESQIKELNGLKGQISSLENQMQKNELEHEKLMIALEKQYQGQIAELREKHLQEVEHYQAKYKDLLDKQAEQTENA